MYDVYIPSYKRPTVLTQNLLPRCKVVIRKSDYKLYKDSGVKNLVVVEDSVQGNVARVRNWIMKNATSNTFLIMDDDIESIDMWVMRENKFNKLGLINSELERFLDVGFNMCLEGDFKLWGVNCIADRGAYHEYTPFSFTSFMSGAMHGHVNNGLLYDEKIPLKEDYDMCIQVCDTYRRLLRFNFVTLNKKDHKNKGGCAEMRTMDREKDQLRLLINKWGNEIIKNDKNNDKVRQKKKKDMDFNPIVKIPIRGI